MFEAHSKLIRRTKEKRMLRKFVINIKFIFIMNKLIEMKRSFPESRIRDVHLN